jgi:glycopeptide antibiotics resistance protein
LPNDSRTSSNASLSAPGDQKSSSGGVQDVDDITLNSMTNSAKSL